VGYHPRLWRQAIELEEAFGRLVEMGHGAILTGWGIGQDIAFLVGTCRRLGLPWPFAALAIDIQGIARKLLNAGDVDRFNLGHVADRLRIGRMGEHGALADAYATYDILLKLEERSGAAHP
jgi:DNA polymerase III epsilon subunit-like protein